MAKAFSFQHPQKVSEFQRSRALELWNFL